MSVLSVLSVKRVDRLARLLDKEGDRASGATGTPAAVEVASHGYRGSSAGVAHAESVGRPRILTRQRGLEHASGLRDVARQAVAATCRRARRNEDSVQRRRGEAEPNGRRAGRGRGATATRGTSQCSPTGDHVHHLVPGAPWRTALTGDAPWWRPQSPPAPRVPLGEDLRPPAPRRAMYSQWLHSSMPARAGSGALAVSSVAGPAVRGRVLRLPCMKPAAVSSRHSVTPSTSRRSAPTRGTTPSTLASS